MTLKQFEEKIKELVKNEAAAIQADCARLFKSGAVDVHTYQNDFILPRLVLVSVLKNRGTNTPIRNRPEYHRTLKTLDHF